MNTEAPSPYLHFYASFVVKLWFKGQVWGILKKERNLFIYLFLQASSVSESNHAWNDDVNKPVIHLKNQPNKQQQMPGMVVWRGAGLISGPESPTLQLMIRIRIKFLNVVGLEMLQHVKITQNTN